MLDPILHQSITHIQPFLYNLLMSKSKVFVCPESLSDTCEQVYWNSPSSVWDSDIRGMHLVALMMQRRKLIFMTAVTVVSTKTVTWEKNINDSDYTKRAQEMKTQMKLLRRSPHVHRWEKFRPKYASDVGNLHLWVIKLHLSHFAF